jgi:competence protein ComEA
MLSRLMTRREQLLLLGVGVAICVGAGALYVHGRASLEKEPESQVVRAAPIEDVKVIPLEPVSAPAPEPVPEEPLVLLTPPPKLEPDLAVSAAGAVQDPGMYKLKEGARVQDLLDAAHGVREDADLSDINLAARVIDGTTLTVPSRATASREGTKLRIRSGESAAALNLPEYTISGWRPAEVRPAGQTSATETPVHAGAPAAAAPPGLIDLNTATQAALESLPGIGPKTAEKIIAYRTRVPFRSVDDLANVSGIGPKKLEAVRSLVTVGGK